MPPFETTLDLFWFALTILVICLTILLSVLLVKVISILSDVKSTTSFIKDTAALINEYAWKPIEVLVHLKDFIVKHVNAIAEEPKKKRTIKKKT